MKMPDAMRFVGLDEVRIATEYKSLIESPDTRKNPKLKLDLLRDCTKHLDPAPRQGPADQDPVQIIVDVPRPVRDTPASESEVSESGSVCGSGPTATVFRG